MRIYDQDFRYLLLHLVPQHRLSPDLRRDVDQALRNGESQTLRRESVRALEELCEGSYFERTSVRPENGRVVVGYRRRGGNYQVSVALPRDEWAVLSSGSDSSFAAAPDTSRATSDAASVSTDPVELRFPGPVPVPTDSVDSKDLLPVIIRSFAIVDRQAPILERIDVLLGALERWLGMTSASLDILEDAVVGDEDSSHARVRVVSDAELRVSDVVRRAIESGARHLTPRANLDAATAGGQATWEVLGVAPIFVQGKVVGALRACFATGLERATMDSRLDTAAGVVRHVIEFHHQFENLTSVDSLTGIYNRQFFDRQLPVEIERAMRSGTSLSMLVVDIDDFKRINDDLGHKKGDEALVAVADIIHRNLRKVDTPFRYGGEEIVILLPGTPEFEAVHTAERLRRVVHQYRGFRDGRGNPREISVSVGVAVYPDTAKTADQLFSQADQAMYRAKQRGKNQVVLYSNS